MCIRDSPPREVRPPREVLFCAAAASEGEAQQRKQTDDQNRRQRQSGIACGRRVTSLSEHARPDGGGLCSGSLSLSSCNRVSLSLRSSLLGSCLLYTSRCV